MSIHFDKSNSNHSWTFHFLYYYSEPFHKLIKNVDGPHRLIPWISLMHIPKWFYILLQTNGGSIIHNGWLICLYICCKMHKTAGEIVGNKSALVIEWQIGELSIFILLITLKVWQFLLMPCFKTDFILKKCQKRT